MLSPRLRRYRSLNERPKNIGITQISSGKYNLSSSERIMLSVMESIPDELLFNILVYVPAQDIYHAARLVCRKWYHIMHDHNFSYKHLHHATYGLLYHDNEGSIVFMYVREGKIKTYKLMDFNLRFQIWTSCNGLILEKERDGDAYVVANPSTDEAFRLPPYPKLIGSPYYIGIGYAAASMTYKVVAAHSFLFGKGCDIFTVGVDKSWRFISTDHLSPTTKESIWSIPLITESFMHWHINSTQVVTLNVETEIITETHPPIPTNIIEKKRRIYCFSTGRYLSLLVSCGELMWEVWEMKPETGEWRMLPEIFLQGQKDKLEELGLKKGGRVIPRGWVKYPEVLALQIFYYDVSCFIYFYNLVKREICSEKVYINCCHSLVLHKNSLISPFGVEDANLVSLFLKKFNI